jgi:hypothetical protein
MASSTPLRLSATTEGPYSMRKSLLGLHSRTQELQRTSQAVGGHLGTFAANWCKSIDIINSSRRLMLSVLERHQ